MTACYISRSNPSREDIQHYGVLGMKWGVRHDPMKAYSRANNKMIKLNSNIQKRGSQLVKAQIKANTGVSKKYSKLQIKADRIQRNADKKKYGLFSNSKKAGELQAKADRAQYKANKYKVRAEKRAKKAGIATVKYRNVQRKAEKWAKSMDRTFADYDVSKLTSQQTDKGKAVAKKIIDAAA